MDKRGGFSGCWELVFLMLVVGGVFVSVPVFLGRLGMSWDSLNHQVYLGWQAQSSRFDEDYMAASLQSYQYPYLYWPLYALTALGVSGRVAGVVLALLHLVVIPPVWLIARTLIPGAGWRQTVFRVSGVLMSFMSILVLKSFEVPGNDLLAAAPLLFALAIALPACSKFLDGERRTSLRSAGYAGFWAGVSVAFKLSNAYSAIFLPVLFLMAPNDSPLRERVRCSIACYVLTLIGFVGAYGYWGYRLFQEFGSPLFPFWGG
jgi:hypothetical protein